MSRSVIVAPLSGACIPLEEVSDPAFACGALGDGVGIAPSCGRVVSPVDGMVLVVASTRHAILLRASDGMEVLVHCGIDTVRLEGAPFDVHVAVGERVRAGQPLMVADLAAIRAAGLDTTTLVVVTEAPEHAAPVAACGDVVAVGEPLLVLD